MEVDSAAPLEALLLAGAGVAAGAAGAELWTLGVLNPTFIGVCLGPLFFVSSTFVSKNHFLDVFSIGYAQLFVCQQPIRV